jgi:thiamine-phosphate pyrophosphorylase
MGGSMMDGTLRLVDANLNRASEAVRVLEDVVRFALEEGALGSTLRRMRHGLGALVADQDLDLLASRDVRGDVGRQASTEARRDLAQLARANFKRLQEALRVLEECGLRGAASLRFRAYDLERDVVPKLEREKKLEKLRIYVLLTPPWLRGDPVGWAARLYEAGADAIQLRLPGASDRELHRHAAAIARRARDEGKLFFVNNRVDVARAVGATGVHLGLRDLPVAVARTLLRPDQLVGATTHDAREADRAVRAGADYISVGPVYGSRTKPELAAGGLSAIRKALRLDVPVVAIGGISLDRVEELARLGVSRVAVAESVLTAENPRRVIRRMKKLLYLGKIT